MASNTKAQIYDENRYYRDPMSHKYNLSFAGCGFLGIYHVGVISCIKQFAPYLYKNKPISGVSAGGLAAACLCCDIDINDILTYLNELIENSRRYFFGAFDIRFKINEYLKEGLERILPQDAHLLCTHRLHISLTCISNKKNIIVNKYRSREQLIRVLLCSAFIPVFSGFIPITYHGEVSLFFLILKWAMDGALSNNMLDLDKNTITISPFAGDADICPRGEMVSTPIEDCFGGQVRLSATTLAMNFFNATRMINVVFPMNPDNLMELVEQGFDDAKRYLITRGLIVCPLHRTPSQFSTIAKRQRSISMNTPGNQSCNSPGVSDSGKAQRTHRTKRRHKNMSSSIRRPFQIMHESTKHTVENPLLDTSLNSPASDEDPSTYSHPLFLGACTRLSNPNCLACKSLVRKAMSKKCPTSLKELFYASHNTDEGSILSKSFSATYYASKLLFSSAYSSFDWINNQGFDLSNMVSNAYYM